MTVLQEEQEKPQIETGPTRHAKIMRGIVTPIFGLLAIACVVFGVLNSTVWKPDNEITAAAPVNGSEYVVTDPNVLQLVDSRVNISAKSRDKKSNVCIAIGSARDVAGWIAGSKYMRVSGLSDWTTLSTMKVSAQGTADNSQNQVAFKDSDMWRTIKCNDGAVDMQVKGSNSNNAEDVVALIDFGNRVVTCRISPCRCILPADCWRFSPCFPLPYSPCRRISAATSALSPWSKALASTKAMRTRFRLG